MLGRRRWKGYTGLRTVAKEPSISDLMGVRLGTRTSGREYVAYPRLAEARWLFPASSRAVRRSSIGGLFQPSTLRGRALKELIALGTIRGERIHLHEDDLTRLEAEIARTLGERDMLLAFYVGVPSPHRKVTAQILDPEGRMLAYTKIATSSLSQVAVEVEQHTLLRLSESESLRGRIPEILGWYSWQGGKGIVITGRSSPPGPKRLNEAHLSFFRDLFLSSRRECVFDGSPMWSRMFKLWQNLEHSFPVPEISRLGLALELLGDQLGSVSLPVSQAHGDFAPWNTRLRSGSSLFVFDWERAAEGVTPLYDAFNFQAFQAALHGRQSTLPEHRFMRVLLNVLWPEGQKHLAWLYLAYLVDVALIYSEAQVLAPGVGERKWWNWFMRQIETFLEGRVPL